MKKAAAIMLFTWFCIVFLFIVSQESVRYFGKEVLLQVRPIDPRDILRGDYVDLEFNISKYKIEDDAFLRYDKPVYVVLNTDNDSAQIDYVTQKKMPKSKLFIKGKIANFSSKEYKFKYGIESYFVKQNTGRELEKELSQGAYATVKIDKFGRAKIISLGKNKPI